MFFSPPRTVLSAILRDEYMAQLTFSSNFYWNICFKFCILEQIIATVLFICISSINNKRSLLRFQSTTAPTNRGWSACAQAREASSARLRVQLQLTRDSDVWWWRYSISYRVFLEIMFCFNSGTSWRNTAVSRNLPIFPRKFAYTVICNLYHQRKTQKVREQGITSSKNTHHTARNLWQMPFYAPSLPWRKKCDFNTFLEDMTFCPGFSTSSPGLFR